VLELQQAELNGSNYLVTYHAILCCRQVVPIKISARSKYDQSGSGASPPSLLPLTEAAFTLKL
jgi:hypothetical protein